MLSKPITLLTKHSLLCLLAIVSINAEVQAQTVTNNNSANSQPNQNQTLDNQQRNSAAVNQTGVYNLGESASYKIQGVAGIQVVCPRPSLILGAAASSFDGVSSSSNTSYAVNAALIFPLGGSLDSTCKGMAQTIAKKTQYDLEIINARACAELKSAGIQLTPESFPTIYGVCQGVSINRTATNEPKQPIRFQPPDASTKEAPKTEVDKDN